MATRYTVCLYIFATWFARIKGKCSSKLLTATRRRPRADLSTLSSPLWKWRWKRKLEMVLKDRRSPFSHSTWNRKVKFKVKSEVIFKFDSLRQGGDKKNRLNLTLPNWNGSEGRRVSRWVSSSVSSNDDSYIGWLVSPFHACYLNYNLKICVYKTVEWLILHSKV